MSIDRESVVVVEGDAGVRELIRLVLERELGVDTILVGDDSQAYQQVCQAKPAVVLLDVALPRLDGTEVVRRLKADPATRGYPVIALAALHKAREAALEAGCDDILDKPFDIDCLLTKVQRHLRNGATMMPEDPPGDSLDADDREPRQEGEAAAASPDAERPPQPQALRRGRLRTVSGSARSVCSSLAGLLSRGGHRWW